MTSAFFDNVSIEFSIHGAKSSPIQITISASWRDFASDGRKLYPCGDAPAGITRLGVPTPSITRETRECTGAISTATFGTSAKAVLPKIKPRAV